MSSEVSIGVDNVAKAYRVYAKPTDRLRQAIMPRLRRMVAPLLRAFGRPIEPAPYFSEHWALCALSFEVKRGETIGVIGRNGSGKSTLLQLICGTLTPSQGSIAVTGRVAALLELGSGFNPEYSGRENVFLNASVLGLTREETIARLDEILDFADIGDSIDQPVKTYSSGMAMRLAFSVIAHVDADVLIIDEALSVGDAYFQQKCLRWLRGFQQNGTVLFCSHDTGAVLTFCDRAIWLDSGNLRMSGPSKEVCESYNAFINAATQGLAKPAPKPSAADDGKDAALTSARAARLLPKAPQLEEPVIFDWLQESASFGSGDAEILSVELITAGGQVPTWIIGGEDLCIIAQVKIVRDIASPVFGFHAKDRLGQPIFGDNTISSGAEVPQLFYAGQTVICRFEFTLPMLMSGRYSITFAVASGTLETHSQHHWVHDVLFFDIHSPYRNGVLLAIDMRKISVDVESLHRDEI
jgi:lipopolysaccharide transport system ATP-binding protein